MSLIKANAHQVGDYTLTNEGGKLIINQGTPDTVLNPVGTFGLNGLEYDGAGINDVLDGAVSKADYVELRAYTGRAKRIYITGVLVTAKPAGIAGVFQYDTTDTTSLDDGGTIIVLADGRRFKRDFDDVVIVDWFETSGNGTGNDASAIQKAIDVASSLSKNSGRSTVSCKAGNIYRLESDIRIKRVTLDATGASFLLAGTAGF